MSLKDVLRYKGWYTDPDPTSRWQKFVQMARDDEWYNSLDAEDQELIQRQAIYGEFAPIAGPEPKTGMEKYAGWAFPSESPQEKFFGTYFPEAGRQAMAAVEFPVRTPINLAARASEELVGGDPFTKFLSETANWPIDYSKSLTEPWNYGRFEGGADTAASFLANLAVWAPTLGMGLAGTLPAGAGAAVPGVAGLHWGTKAITPLLARAGMAPEAAQGLGSFLAMAGMPAVEQIAEGVPVAEAAKSIPMGAAMGGAFAGLHKLGLPYLGRVAGAGALGAGAAAVEGGGPLEALRGGIEFGLLEAGMNPYSPLREEALSRAKAAKTAGPMNFADEESAFRFLQEVEPQFVEGLSKEIRVNGQEVSPETLAALKMGLGGRPDEILEQYGLLARQHGPDLETFPETETVTRETVLASVEQARAAKEGRNLPYDKAVEFVKALRAQRESAQRATAEAARAQREAYDAEVAAGARRVEEAARPPRVPALPETTGLTQEAMRRELAVEEQRRAAEQARAEEEQRAAEPTAERVRPEEVVAERAELERRAADFRWRTEQQGRTVTQGIEEALTIGMPEGKSRELTAAELHRELGRPVEEVNAILKVLADRFEPRKTQGGDVRYAIRGTERVRESQEQWRKRNRAAQPELPFAPEPTPIPAEGRGKETLPVRAAALPGPSAPQVTPLPKVGQEKLAAALRGEEAAKGRGKERVEREVTDQELSDLTGVVEPRRLAALGVEVRPTETGAVLSGSQKSLENVAGLVERAGMFGGEAEALSVDIPKQVGEKLREGSRSLQGLKVEPSPENPSRMVVTGNSVAMDKAAAYLNSLPRGGVSKGVSSLLSKTAGDLSRASKAAKAGPPATVSGKAQRLARTLTGRRPEGRGAKKDFRLTQPAAPSPEPVAEKPAPPPAAPPTPPAKPAPKPPAETKPAPTSEQVPYWKQLTGQAAAAAKKGRTVEKGKVEGEAKKEAPPKEEEKVSAKEKPSRAKVLLELHRRFPGAFKKVRYEKNGDMTLETVGGKTVVVRPEAEITSLPENVMKAETQLLTKKASAEAEVTGTSSFISGVELLRLTERGIYDTTPTHESLHVARDLGLITEAEWKVLKARYTKDLTQEEIDKAAQYYIDEYDMSLKLAREVVLEEKIASGIEFARTAYKVGVKDFWRDRLREMGNWLKDRKLMAGYRHVIGDEVVRSIRTGEILKRVTDNPQLMDDMTPEQRLAIQESLVIKPIEKASIRTLPEHSKALVKRAKELGIPEEATKEWLRDAYISAETLKVYKELLPTPQGKTPIRKNRGYGLSMDFDALCPRATAYYQAVYAVEKVLGYHLSGDERVAITQSMRKIGLIPPCSQCYTEAGRRQLANARKKWAAQMNIPEQAIDDTEFAAKWIGTSRERQARFDRLMAKNAGISNKIKGYAEYRGQLLRLAKNNPELAEEYRTDGFLRWFSNSDFKVEHMVDAMQAMQDMAVERFKGIAYTKQESFIKVFHKTGMKINASIAGIWDPETKTMRPDLAAGMDWDVARGWERKSPDVGVAFLAKNPEQVAWAMKQKWIQNILLFRKSGNWNQRATEALGVPDANSYVHMGANTKVYRELMKQYADHPDFIKLTSDNPRRDTKHRAVTADFDIEEANKLITEWGKTKGSKVTLTAKMTRELVRDVKAAPKKIAAYEAGKLPVEKAALREKEKEGEFGTKGFDFSYLEDAFSGMWDDGSLSLVSGGFKVKDKQAAYDLAKGILDDIGSAGLGQTDYGNTYFSRGERPALRRLAKKLIEYAKGPEAAAAIGVDTELPVEKAAVRGEEEEGRPKLGLIQGEGKGKGQRRNDLVERLAEVKDQAREALAREDETVAKALMSEAGRIMDELSQTDTRHGLHIVEKLRLIPKDMDGRKFYDYMEDAGLQEVLDEFRKAKQSGTPLTGRQGWTPLDAARVKKAWDDYSKTGEAGLERHAEALDRMAIQTVRNIFRLNANSLLAGYAEMRHAGRRREFINWVNEKYDGEGLNLQDGFEFLDFITVPEAGEQLRGEPAPRTSDSALTGKLFGAIRGREAQKDPRSLLDIAYDIAIADTPEQQLLAIDRVFNLTHARTDLASWFIEGGKRSLDKLAGAENRKFHDTSSLTIKDISEIFERHKRDVEVGVKPVTSRVREAADQREMDARREAAAKRREAAARLTGATWKKPQPLEEAIEEERNPTTESGRKAKEFFETGKVTTKKPTEKAAIRPRELGQKFVDRDVVPAVREAIGTVEKIGKEILDLVAPTLRADPKTVDEVHRMLGKKGRTEFEVDVHIEEARKKLGKLTRDQQIQVFDELESKARNSDPVIREFEDYSRAINDMLAREILKRRPGAFSAIADYFGHRWATLPNAPQTAKPWSGKGNRPLEGSMRYFKQRKIERISQGIKLGGEPESWNAAEMLMSHVQDVTKFLTAFDMLDAFKKSGVAKLVRKHRHAPEGWKALDPKQTRLLAGPLPFAKIYMTPDAHRILNNYLSRDLIRESSLGRGLMGLKNLTTQIELGISGFHATFEAAELIGSQVGLGLRKMMNTRDFAGGAADILSAPLAPYTTYKLGRSVERYIADPQKFSQLPEVQWLRSKVPDMDIFVQDLFNSGARLRIDESYKTAWLKGFRGALAEGNYIGAIARGPLAAMEGSMRWLFENLIPRWKTGLWAKEYVQTLAERSADIASGQVTREKLARDVWKFTEDRLGEMNFDTLFWNRTFKSALQMMFRSVTWKLGNLRGFGKVVPREAKAIKDYIRNKENPVLDQNLAWLFGMSLITATFGTVAQKLLTGKDPGEDGEGIGDTLKDLVFPRMDKDDDSMRLNTPTYWKDALHLIDSPTKYVRSSMSGMMSRGLEIWANQDFYGQQVSETTDSDAQAVWKYFSHLFPLPISIQSFIRLKEAGRPELGVASFAGITKAPGYISLTDAQRLMREITGEKEARGGRTAEQVEKSQQRYEALVEMRKGKQVAKPPLLSEQEWKKLLKDVGEDPDLLRLKRLTVPEVVRVWNEATEKERKAWRDALLKKLDNLAKTGPPPATMKKLREAYKSAVKYDDVRWH